LKLTPNPTPSSPNSDTLDRARFICPLTLKEMNGQQPFLYISKCGCVLSSAGFKALSSTPPKDATNGDELDVCPSCATKFSRSEDVTPLNPSAEETEKLMERLLVKRAAEKKERDAKKSGKKRKKDSAEDAGDEKHAKKEKPSGTLPSMNPSVAASVASSLALEEAKRKANMSAAVKSLYGDGKKDKKETFMTMGTFTRVSLSSD
jgi:ribosome-binding protein aMBF1 (putative translation factor)